MGFRALGLDTYAADTPEEGKSILHRLAKEDCAVIYMTEQLAAGWAEGTGHSIHKDVYI